LDQGMGGFAEHERWSPTPWGAAPPPGGGRRPSSAPRRGLRRPAALRPSLPLFGLARAAVSAATACAGAGGSRNGPYPPGSQQREEAP
jgi:hypothetical protein